MWSWLYQLGHACLLDTRGVASVREQFDFCLWSRWLRLWKCCRGGCSAQDPVIFGSTKIHNAAKAVIVHLMWNQSKIKKNYFLIQHGLVVEVKASRARHSNRIKPSIYGLKYEIKDVFAVAVGQDNSKMNKYDSYLKHAGLTKLFWVRYRSAVISLESCFRM